MDVFKLGPQIVKLLNAALSFYSSQVDTVLLMLRQSPQEVLGGGPWQNVERLEPIFTGVGASLVVLFFIIGFCAESVNLKEELRFENILRMLIKIGIAEWLVSYNLAMVKTFCQSIGNLIALLGAQAPDKIVVDAAHTQALEELNFGESLVMLIVAAVAALVIVVSAAFLLYAVYFRMIRVFLVAPLGALAFSTTAGGSIAGQTSLSYLKYMLSILLEAVVMVLAILVCNSFIASGLVEGGGGTDFGGLIIYLLSLSFVAAFTAGTVKGAQTLTSRVFGL